MNSMQQDIARDSSSPHDYKHKQSKHDMFQYHTHGTAKNEPMVSKSEVAKYLPEKAATSLRCHAILVITSLKI